MSRDVREALGEAEGWLGIAVSHARHDGVDPEAIRTAEYLEGEVRALKERLGAAPPAGEPGEERKP